MPVNYGGRSTQAAVGWAPGQVTPSQMILVSSSTPCALQCVQQLLRHQGASRQPHRLSATGSWLLVQWASGHGRMLHSCTAVGSQLRLEHCCDSPPTSCVQLFACAEHAASWSGAPHGPARHAGRCACTAAGTAAEAAATQWQPCPCSAAAPASCWRRTLPRAVHWHVHLCSCRVPSCRSCKSCGSFVMCSSGSSSSSSETARVLLLRNGSLLLP